MSRVESEKPIVVTSLALADKETSPPASAAPDLQVNRNWTTGGSLFRWFHPDDEPAERRLIVKLDCAILAFACAAFWALYIDRSVYSHTYVSGMKQDLKFYSNQYVHINSIFTSGYALSIIPLTLVNTRAPPQIVIPICMIVWGLFTSLGTRADSFSELAGYRFLVGFGEGAFFPSINYILGSWYRPDEIARRAGLFYVSGSIGSISAGFLSARIYHDLDGVLGRAGWRWMYLISGIVTFPIALLGIFTFPGTPQHPNRRVFCNDELLLARARLDAIERRPTRTVTLSKASVKRFFGRWHFWVLVPWSVAYQQGYLAMPQATYTLWIKSNKHYSTVEVNNLTVVAPCVGIVAIVLFAWIADRFGSRARLPVFAFAHLVAALGLIAFVAYDKTPFEYKWYGVAVSNVLNASVPVMNSWVNEICTHDAEERAFVLGAILAFAMAFNSWVPVLSMPTVEAPRYFKGYLVCLVMQPVALALAFLVNYLHKQLVDKNEGDERRRNGGGAKQEGGLRRQINTIETEDQRLGTRRVPSSKLAKMGALSFFRRKKSKKTKSTKDARRLQILSDLHLEVGQQYASFDVPVTAPYLVLAGDIGRLVDYDALLHNFLARLAPSYRQIFYVLGNHEFYGLTYEGGIEAARRLEGEPCLHGKLTVVHCDKWEEIDEGVGEEAQTVGGKGVQPRMTILGCTLWSEVPEEAQAIVQNKVGDFRKIDGWTMDQHNRRHAEEAAWLREAVAAFASRGRDQGPLCVITHHAPSLKGTSSPKNAANPWTSGFATELLGDGSGIWLPRVHLWVFGHTHHCVDDPDCHGVHLVANQRGYVLPGSGKVTETPGMRTFDPGFVVEL